MILLLSGALTAYALFMNTITLASNDYRSVVIQACIGAFLALVLAAVGWRRSSRLARLTAVPAVVVAAVTLADAGSRLHAILTR